MSTADLEDQLPTGASIGSDWDIGPSTRTISKVVEEVGHYRNLAKLLAGDAGRLSQSVDVSYSEILEVELEATTSRRAREELTGLLEELNSLGFSWQWIARIAQVSVPALRKWRKGAPATGDNRRRVAEVAALCQIVREKFLIEDVAGWLETPLHSEAPTTGLDLLAGDRGDLVLILASNRVENPEQVLDEFQPGWRDHHASSVEVFAAPDGLPGIRFSENER